LRPIYARINLPEGKTSYLLQEFTQLCCVEKAFGVGARQFEAVFHQRLSVDVLEDINRAMGEQADRFLDDLLPPPRAAEGAILVATADGKGVSLVKQDAQGGWLRPSPHHQPHQPCPGDGWTNDVVGSGTGVPGRFCRGAIGRRQAARSGGRSGHPACFELCVEVSQGPGTHPPQN
jgi:hypothetical protein